MKRGREQSDSGGGQDQPSGEAVPGKRTRTQAMSPVQRQESATPALAASPPAAAQEDPFGMHLAAAEAPAGPLPHLPQMERLFGEDLSGVRAHVGAASSLDVQDATGAAQGDTVAFASTTPGPSLVAHETAHVVQQRRAGGSSVAWKRLDRPDSDPAEREADQVAELVEAKGASAEPVQVTAAPSAAVQFQKKSSGKKPAAAPAADDAPSVRDPIVRGAATEAKQLPARVLKLRKLSEDFQIARGDLDGDSVGAIGVRLATAWTETEAALARLGEGVDNADLLGAVGVEYSWDPKGEKEAARTEELTQIKYARDDISLDLSAWSTLIANSIRPTSFQHQEVPGSSWVPRPEEMPAFIREQTTKTILLIDTVHEIQAMLDGASGQPLQVAVALRKEAANRFQFWLSDRDGLMFLAHALRKLGHGDLLNQKGIDGKELTKTVDAVTRGVPQTVADIIETVREAKNRDVVDHDKQGALTLLNLARERVNELARQDKVKESIPKGTHGLTFETALFFAQEAKDGLREQGSDLERDGRVGEGLWNRRIQQLEMAKPVLTVITGETAYSDSFLTAIGPASKTSLITAGILGGTVIAGAAGATWLAANAAAIAEVGLGAYSAAVVLIVRNPYAATALAEFATGIGFNVLEAGSFENFLDRLKTPEGVMQLVMDLLILKQSMGGGRFGGNTGDADAPDAPRRPAPDMDEGSTFGAEVRDVFDKARAFKAATVEYVKQPRRPGQQPAAVTPDGDAVPVPGRAGSDDLPGFNEMYAQQLADRRSARVARGGRRVWPTPEQWEAEYHPPPAGKEAAEVREKLMEAASVRYPVTDEMTNQEKTLVYWKQKSYFDGVEHKARARRNELREQLANASPDEHQQIKSDLERAELMLEISLVKPVQGRLPINHEFAGSSVTLEHIDAKIADVTLKASERVRLQEARVVMVELGITEVRFTRDGYPDFSPFVYKQGGVRAEVDFELKGNRGADDTMANQAYREKIGDPRWRKPGDYTWHHVEIVGKMILVKREIHDAIKHTGGVALWRMLTGDLDAY